MLVLFETAAGYAIFKLLNDRKLAQLDNLYLDFNSPETASKVVNLKHFYKFEDTTEALAAITAAVEGKLCKSLKKTLKKYCVELQEQLAVADAKLGNAIKDKLGLSCVSNTAVQELMRCIRSQMDSLLTGVATKEITAMRLGLAHSLSRYKLKFSPDKVDTMVIQAVNLLDELDKELNNYVMRCREWYGWHFPELSKIIPDNMAYVKTVQSIGIRENAVSSELSDILSEEIEEQVKEAAEVSMGTEISEEDAMFTQSLCTEIIELSQYRAQLYDYLKARMMALAPNLSVLVGELVAARLMSHAGSLINLAKHPASTVQILGAEKALFRALKMKKDTPKYGLIYHAQLVGQSSKKNKGKMSRMLAAKASLATRFDALGESTNYDLGAEHKVKLEARLRLLEEGNMRRISGTAKAKAKFEKYHTKSEYFQYSASVDSTLQNNKSLIEKVNTQQDNEETDKKKKKKKQSVDGNIQDAGTSNQEEEAKVKTEPDVVSKKKKKQSMDGSIQEGVSNQEEEIQVKTEQDVISKKKKKKRKHSVTEDISEPVSVQEEAQVETELSAVSKKKKKRSSVFMTEDTKEPSDAQNEPQNELQDRTEPMAVPKKKKKRSLQSNTEDIGEPSNVQEVTQAETELTAVSKKKKKRSLSSNTENTAEPSGAQEEAQTELDSEPAPKKKKKRSMISNTEGAEVASGTREEAQEETDPDVVPKKKKKKSKQKLVETEESIPVTTDKIEVQADVSIRSEASETSEGQKKKKKKKKEKQ